MINRLKTLPLRAWLPIAALAPVLNFILARSLTATDGRRVWVAGYELHGACWVQERFGAACPFCGITRSVVLTIHGEITRAAELNPAGVMIVCGVVLVCVVCAFLVFTQSSRAHVDAAAKSAMKRAHNRIATFFALYAGLTIFVIVGGWAWRFWSV